MQQYNIDQHLFLPRHQVFQNMSDLGIMETSVDTNVYSLMWHPYILPVSFVRFVNPLSAPESR